jgi:hypothetical protein
MIEKVSNLSIRYKDAFEKARLELLAGENTVTDYVLERAFNVRLSRGSDRQYPGWEAVERGRRDGGIKISHPAFPDPVVLYPEDDAYGLFEE